MFLYKLVNFPDKQCIYGHKCKNGMPLLRYAVFLYLCELSVFSENDSFRQSIFEDSQGIFKGGGAPF